MDWDLIVVGAGISGLAAADALVERGWRVLVVERASRLGGRIRTDRSEREPLEMGPSFVGPTQGNMQALIRRFGLSIKYNDFPDDRLSVNHFDLDWGFPYRSTFQGTYTSVPEIERAIAALDKLTAQTAANLERPWDLVEFAHYDSVSVREWSDGVLTAGQYGGFAFVMRHLLGVFVRSILSVEPEELSMLFFLYYVARCGGFRYMVTAVDYGPDSQRVREGLDTLVERLAQSIRERGGTIRTDAAVSTIDNSGDRVGVVVNGEQIFAHRMVVAVPPSAAVAMEYRVPLPEARRRLCEQMLPGSTFKGYVVFDEPWFHHLSVLERIRKTDLRMPRLDTTLRTKRGALSRMRSLGVVVPTGYTGYTNGDFYKVSWTMDGTWYDPSGKPTQPAIMWFVVGENARKFAELDREARRAAVLADLEDLFRGCRFPTDGMRYHEQDWTKPPHDAGPTEVMSQELLTRDGAALREPFGRIHWAGTEVAVHWGGYMEGGVDAGLRAAREAHDALIAEDHDPPRA